MTASIHLSLLRAMLPQLLTILKMYHALGFGAIFNMAGTPLHEGIDVHSVGSVNRTDVGRVPACMA